MKHLLLLSLSLLILHSATASVATPATALDHVTELQAADPRSDKESPTSDSKPLEEADPDSVIDFPTSTRAKGGRRNRRFPKFCACKQVRDRRGRCYLFLKSKGYKCKSRRCVRRYACVSKKFLKRFGKSKKITVCIKRTTNKTIVPWVRKGRKGYCKLVKTRKRIFYVPYVRK